MILSNYSKSELDRLMGTHIPRFYAEFAAFLLLKTFSLECLNFKMRYEPDEVLLIIAELAGILFSLKCSEILNKDGTVSEILEDYFILKAPILVRVSIDLDDHKDKQTNNLNNHELMENDYEG
jgi:ribosome-interacting GTPase 1